MPDLTPKEHQLVIDVLDQYVSSLDALIKMYPLSQEAKTKRHEMLAVLGKLNEPDPLVKLTTSLDPTIAPISGRGKILQTFRTGKA